MSAGRARLRHGRLGRLVGRRAAMWSESVRAGERRISVRAMGRISGLRGEQQSGAVASTVRSVRRIRQRADRGDRTIQRARSRLRLLSGLSGCVVQTVTLDFADRQRLAVIALGVGAEEPDVEVVLARRGRRGGRSPACSSCCGSGCRPTSE